MLGKPRYDATEPPKPVTAVEELPMEEISLLKIPTFGAGCSVTHASQ
jgi:hypothetical protein